MALGVPFGNYRLVRRIARGGMAEVFLAWQLSSAGDSEGSDSDGFYDSATGIRFARQVAVKRILPHLSESEEFRALFLQEARLAATLSHPNIVHIYDFGRTGDCLFLAMELIEGVSLSALIRAARTEGLSIPIEHAVRIAADALAGLHHAHTRTDAAGRPQHIVHRDVSPQNILVTLDGVVKVLDFGIAKAAWSAQETRPGMIRGKYAYMSPEQAEGLRLDGRSDVHALGVCLYELLTGMPLVPRDLPIDTALRAIRAGVALEGLGQLELLRPDVPPELHAILRRALQTRRDHRYSSAAEMQLDLERFLKAWPHMSSSLLLGEYLRRHHLRPAVGKSAGDPTEHITPLVYTAQGPCTNVAPEAEAPAATEGPTQIQRLPALRLTAGASENTFIPAADTVVDPCPAGAAAPDNHLETARVALPTVLVSRAALPTWRPGWRQGAESDTAPVVPSGPTLLRDDNPSPLVPPALLPAESRSRGRTRGWLRRRQQMRSRWGWKRWRYLIGPLGAAGLLLAALLWRGCP